MNNLMKFVIALDILLAAGCGRVSNLEPLTHTGCHVDVISNTDSEVVCDDGYNHTFPN
jgi:hypothetical protein